MKKSLLTGLLICFMGFAHIALAEAPDPDPERFADAIGAFVAWDRKNAFPDNPMLFVGSSSIRFWPTAEAFPGLPVVNRGFGGSEISDVLHFYEQVIEPYAPARIILYAGDNDIARGKPAERVFEDYRELAERVLQDFPNTELIFISIKPSKSRWSLWPVMQEANRLVRQYAGHHPQLVYADLAGILLDESGQPGDVFVEDGLHLSEDGYRLWQAALAPYLQGGR